MTEKSNSTLLIVDDDHSLQELIVEILKQKYRVVNGTQNATIALKMMNVIKYDLIIVDLNMPGMGGQEFIKHIRSSGDHRTAILILTGGGTFKDAHELLQHVIISDFLRKPVKTEQLYFSIDKALKEQAVTFDLEENVAKRTSELKASQYKLVQSEKLASLGKLVAGVAHEVNTPIGTAQLGISYLEEYEIEFSKKFLAGSMTKTNLNDFLKVIRDTVSESKQSLVEANRIISVFKQLAVDQASENKREFFLLKTINGVLSTLHIQKMKDIKIEINCDESLKLNSFPGALGQVLTNLINNSLLHGFDGKNIGAIYIDASLLSKTVTLTYQDKGIGMNDESLKKVFDPFYTTKTNQGGFGMGMSVSYNIVNDILNGTIECYSQPDKGVTFIIKIPKEIF